MTIQHAQKTKTVVIGFGFSCIGLLRELDRTAEDYIIISDPEPSSIWSGLDKTGRLNFDLVSSYHTSFYSFDLVPDFKEDAYPLASEFYAMHLRYHDQYRHRIMAGHVDLIENFDAFSRIHLADGRCFEAENVVISTAFQRTIRSSLLNFDYGVQNRTIVFDTVGDSSNLMISKLLAGGNRIICLTNGFLAFDKFFCQGDKTATLDQFEFHNFAFLRRIYRSFMGGSPFLFDQLFSNTGGIFGWKLKLAQILTPQISWFKYPDQIHRDEIDTQRQRRGAAIPNGLIAIKYWPVDMYARMFGDDLEGAIRRGCLLNDLPMWIDEGMVEVHAKRDTVIDREAMTLTIDGSPVPYDHLIQGGAETPRHPRITRIRGDEGEEVDHVYSVRDNYLGILPRTLSNVYFLGIIRPFTGGLVNIAEMQGLFIHKMIANPAFRQEIQATLDHRIEDYNEKHYFTRAPKPTDHLVFYGSYTEEVARTIGINPTLRDCRSFADLRKWLLFPNNAFKYRQKGEYAVPGCADLVAHVERKHDYWAAFLMSMASIGLYHLILLVALFKLYWGGSIGIVVLALALAAQFILLPKPLIVLQMTSASVIFLSAYKLWRFAFLLVGLGAVIAGPAWLALPVFGIEIVLTLVLRRFRKDLTRHVFNDLGIKRNYRAFVARYFETYRKVMAEPRQAP